MLPEVIARTKVIPPEEDWAFVGKMMLIILDILFSIPRLAALGWHEEALGKNAIAGGFQGQRH